MLYFLSFSRTSENGKDEGYAEVLKLVDKQD